MLTGEKINKPDGLFFPVFLFSCTPKNLQEQYMFNLYAFFVLVMKIFLFTLKKIFYFFR